MSSMRHSVDIFTIQSLLKIKLDSGCGFYLLASSFPVFQQQNYEKNFYSNRKDKSLLFFWIDSTNIIVCFSFLFYIQVCTFRSCLIRPRIEKFPVKRTENLSYKRGMQTNYIRIWAICRMSQKSNDECQRIFSFYGFFRNAWYFWPFQDWYCFSGTYTIYDFYYSVAQWVKYQKKVQFQG